MKVKEETTAVSNKMILSRSNFSVPQRKILYAIVDTVSPYLKNDLSVKKGKEINHQLGVFNVSSIEYKASDLSRPEDYNELRKALEELQDKKARIETEDKIYSSSIVLSYEFNKRSSYLNILVDVRLVNLLFDLSEGYSLYQTKVVLSFSSIYSMRIYEILAKWRNKKAFYLSIEELRRLTDTEEKYKLTKNLKTRVLDTAKEQLDESEITDLKFDYKDVKEGRRIIGFQIFIHKTDKAHDTPRKKLEPVSLHWDFSKGMVDNFEKFGLKGLKGRNLETVTALKTLIGEQELAKEMERIHSIIKADKTEIKNPIGYLISSLKKLVFDNTKEPGEMTVQERKNYTEEKRNNEPQSIGDLFGNIGFNKGE